MAQAYTPKQILNKKVQTPILRRAMERLCRLSRPRFLCHRMGRLLQRQIVLSNARARYLTQFGKVAYNSLEEGVSHTVQMNMERNYMDGVEGKFLLLDNEPLPELIERMSKHKSPDFPHYRLRTVPACR